MSRRPPPPSCHPTCHEWARTGRAQITGEVIERLRNQFHPEDLERLDEFELQHQVQGGVIEPGCAAQFLFAFNSRAEAKAHLAAIDQLLPSLFRACTNSYPYPLLSQRKKEVLLWRAQGRLPREIGGRTRYI